MYDTYDRRVIWQLTLAADAPEGPHIWSAWPLVPQRRFTYGHCVSVLLCVFSRWQVCVLAASAWLDAVDATLTHGRPSFALTRPPGHHALADQVSSSSSSKHLLITTLILSHTHIHTTARRHNPYLSRTSTTLEVSIGHSQVAFRAV
jgi:hypothetical protein